MPHFENLDQYESTNPKSGNKEIVPIAPHSLQASEYSPDKENTNVQRNRRRKTQFPEVDIEPISVRQMEKEYRASSRKLPRSRKKNRLRKLKRKIVDFFRSLLGLNKKKRKPRHIRNRNSRPRNRQGKKPGGMQNRDNQGQKSNQGQNRNRRRRKRPNQNRQNQNQTQGQPKQGQPKQGQHQKDGGPGKAREGGSQGSGKPHNRNRRNRRRPSNKQGAPNNQRQDRSQ